MTITDSARRLALVAVVAMLAALFPLSGALAQDPGDAIVLDLDGENAVEYSLRWSQVVYDADTLEGDTAPDTALIGRDDIFADSLASGVLQGASDSGSPLLLTPSDALAEETAAELDRLGVENVTILGLEAAISEDVEAELEDLGYTVDRQGGQTRIETAIDIAEDIDSDTAILARAFGTDEETQAFADSLAAGGWAAGSDYPVLLTQTEVLTGNTATHLEEAGYTEVIIVGGEAAVSAEVEASVAELADTVTRVGGGTRFETAVLIAEARGFESPADAEGVILVDGQVDDAWADGFPAANLSGMGWPIVLSNSAADGLPEPTVTWLEGDAAFASEHLTDVVGICGSTVPDDAEGTGGDQCGEFAEILDATVVDFVPPGPGPEPSDNAGIVTNCAAPEITFTNEAGESVTVEYDVADDTFTVDGSPATAGVFGAECSPGDFVTVTTNADDTLTLALDNRTATDYTSGTVGNVDTSASTYDIIEPVSGIVLRTVSYAGDLLFVDGAPATAATFSNDINEGDSISIEQNDANEPQEHRLVNESVAGMVSSVDTETASTIEIQIEGLGDDAETAQNTHFVADDGNDVFVVDGDATAEFADFAAEVSEGDEITYTREGDVETYVLGNLAPPTRTGLATETANLPVDFELLPNDGDGVDTCDMTGATLIVNGTLATPVEFGAAYTPGDEVTCRDADPDGTGQTARVTLDDADLDGFVDAGTATANTADVYRDADLSDDGIAVPVDYTAPGFGGGTQLYFVDGTAVSQADFQLAIQDLDQDDDPTLVVEWGAVSNEWNLDTDASDDAV